MLDRRQRVLMKLVQGVALTCHLLEAANATMAEQLGREQAEGLHAARIKLLERLIHELLLADIPARIVRERLAKADLESIEHLSPADALAVARTSEAFVARRTRSLPSDEPCRYEILTALSHRPLPQAA